MKLGKVIAPMSIVLFVAANFVGACYVRRQILTVHMQAALEMQDVEMVRGLVDKWPSPVDARNKAGDTTLMWALWRGDNETMRRCVLAGADLEARDAGGMTALLLASLKGDRRAAQLFLDHGADVNAKITVPDKKSQFRFLGHYCGPLHPGRTPLHLAVNTQCVQRFHGPDRALCELLLARGADPNARDIAGDTPLHNAVSYRCPEVMDLLVAKGADVNARNNDGDTPLHRASARPYPDDMACLIAKGADVNAKNNAGLTPLRIVRNLSPRTPDDQDRQDAAAAVLLRQLGAKR